MNQRTGKIIEENTARFAAGFEARSELLRAQSCGQLEQQVEQINSQARQAFLRHSVNELNQRQQLWLQQAQKDLNDLAAQNLQQTRRGLSQVMRVLGEAVIRGAYQDVGGREEASSGLRRQDDVPETERIAEGEGCYQLVKTGEL